MSGDIRLGYTLPGYTLLGYSLGWACAALISAGTLHAEGRNDPFLGCVFEDGRQVILAENGDGIEWQEADLTAVAHCTNGRTVICVIEHPDLGPQALVVATGASEQEQRMRVPAGAALLMSVYFVPEQVASGQQKGLCERIGL